jgi:hypothetical protein
VLGRVGATASPLLPGSTLTILDDGRSSILADGHIALSAALVLVLGEQPSTDAHLLSAELNLVGTLTVPLDPPAGGVRHVLFARLGVTGTVVLDAAQKLSASLTWNDPVWVRTVREAGAGVATPSLHLTTGQFQLTGPTKQPLMS